MLAFFEQTGFHIPVLPLFVFGAMVLLFVTWGIFSWVIRYHWKKYGTGKVGVMSMTFFYFIGSALLLGLMALFAFMYHLSSNL